MTQELPEQPGRVPVGELKELVEEWRETADYIHGERGPDVKKRDADDLEAVIERYE